MLYKLGYCRPTLWKFRLELGQSLSIGSFSYYSHKIEVIKVLQASTTIYLFTNNWTKNHESDIDFLRNVTSSHTNSSSVCHNNFYPSVSSYRSGGQNASPFGLYFSTVIYPCESIGQQGAPRAFTCFHILILWKRVHRRPVSWSISYSDILWQIAYH